MTAPTRPGSWLRQCVLAALTVAAWGCVPRHAVERLLIGGHFVVMRDVPYDTGAAARLDVYRPRGVAKGGAPVVVFIHGGRWQYGSKDEYRLLGDAITRRGFVAVTIDYRLYPDVLFPAWVDDAARAVRWVRDSVSKYGGDPARIFVVGHSAGAHTAAILALDGRYLRKVGLQGNAVRGYVSIAGPVASEWTDPDVQTLMGPRQDWGSTYPLQLVTRASASPMLLLHGGEDRTASPVNSARLAARITSLGGCARTIIYRKLRHVSIIIALSVPRFGIAPVLDDIAAFIENPGANTCPERRAPAHAP